MTYFNGIVDLYSGNDWRPQKAWDMGVRAILHRTSIGLVLDKQYLDRKKDALARGFLWGGYHLLSGEDTEAQLDLFLTVENGTDPRVALAIDWENSLRKTQPTMSLTELRRFVTLFNERTGRYPLLYGGSLLHHPALQQGDRLLGSCPLWYVSLRQNESELTYPRGTWGQFTLWQYKTEQGGFGDPEDVRALDNADWNRFKGTLADLQSAWPLS